MIQTGGSCGFGPQAFEKMRIGGVPVGQLFQGHHPSETSVGCQIDVAHAAASDVFSIR